MPDHYFTIYFRPVTGTYSKRMPVCQKWANEMLRVNTRYDPSIRHSNKYSALKCRFGVYSPHEAGQAG